MDSQSEPGQKQDHQHALGSHQDQVPVPLTSKKLFLPSHENVSMLKTLRKTARLSFLHCEFK